MTKQHPDERLEAILSESVASARERECRAFDEAAGPFAQSLVLYGAGNLGRNVLRGLRKNGMDAIAFADANPVLSGKLVEGVPVFSPEDAARKFGKNAAFVVCVWHPDPNCGVQHIVNKLGHLGARAALPFNFLFWKYSDSFLPHYFWDLPSRLLVAAPEINRTYRSFDDELSKAQFVRDLELRLLGRFCERPLQEAGKQYFPRDLFRVSRDECFIDCGAYDGDTIRELVEETGGDFRKAIAFEADPKNFARLQECVTAMAGVRERVVLHRSAVARRKGTLRFAATAGSNASVSASGDTIVPCVALDEVLGDERPTMIKMDIEGSELDALEGAARIIATHNPLLAICVYHCPDHFWKIPHWPKGAVAEARLSLRSHAMDGFDSVCYAVPPDRAA